MTQEATQKTLPIPVLIATGIGADDLKCYLCSSLWLLKTVGLHCKGSGMWTRVKCFSLKPEHPISLALFATKLVTPHWTAARSVSVLLACHLNILWPFHLLLIRWGLTRAWIWTAPEQTISRTSFTTKLFKPHWNSGRLLIIILAHSKNCPMAVSVPVYGELHDVYLVKGKAFHFDSV